MKIAVFGGSFNPPHLAHIGMAKACIDEFGLDEALLVVAANPPHKSIAENVCAELRYNMANIAARGVDKLSVSDIELKRVGKSYTVDTLKALKSCDAYKNADFYLIVGADMLADLPTWYKAPEILLNTGIIAVAREGLDVSEAKRFIENTYGTKVLLSDYNSHGISSSQVRQRVRDALSLQGYVNEDVELLIYENALYWPDELRVITEKLKTELDDKRFKHTMGTVKTAIDLASRFSVDSVKARLAALLHDCARRKSKERLSAMADEYGVSLEADFIPGLVHAPLGAIHANKAYGVSDTEVLDAIKCHTLLRIPLTDLDKIIYIADKTEPYRDYAGVMDIRSSVAGSNSLDEAVLACIDGVSEYERHKDTFDPKILEIRDYIKNKRR